MTQDRIKPGIDEFEINMGIKADPEIFEFYREKWFKPLLLQYISPRIDRLTELYRRELWDDAKDYIRDLERQNMRPFLHERPDLACKGVVVLTVVRPQFPLSKEQEEIVDRYQSAIEDNEAYKAVLGKHILLQFQHHLRTLENVLNVPEDRCFMLKAQSYAKSIPEFEKHYGDVIPASTLAEANELATKLLDLYAQYPEFYDLICALRIATTPRYPLAFFFRL
jgi:hypothetical protein